MYQGYSLLLARVQIPCLHRAYNSPSYQVERQYAYEVCGLNLVLLLQYRIQRMDTEVSECNSLFIVYITRYDVILRRRHQREICPGQIVLVIDVPV